MNSDNSNKWRIRLATLSIFVLGAMAGAFALNAYNLWFGPKPPMSREARFEKISNELKLSEPQKIEMRKIWDETREKMEALRKEDEPKFKAIRDEADPRMQKALLPEQWDKFMQMREVKKKEEEKRREAAR